MANKPLKSIKYPGLSDTYTFVQIGTEAGQAADAKVVENAIDEINSIFTTEVSNKNNFTSDTIYNADGTTQVISGFGSAIIDCENYYQIRYTLTSFKNSSNTLNVISFLTDENEYISGIPASSYGNSVVNGDVRVPENAKYAVGTWQLVKAETPLIIGYKKGSIRQSIEENTLFSNNDKYGKVELLTDKTEFSSNIIYKDDGSDIYDTSSIKTSLMIPCWMFSAIQYTLTSSRNSSRTFNIISFFDDSYKYISGVPSYILGVSEKAEGNADIPNDAKYMICEFDISASYEPRVIGFKKSYAAGLTEVVNSRMTKSEFITAFNAYLPTYATFCRCRTEAFDPIPYWSGADTTWEEIYKLLNRNLRRNVASKDMSFSEICNNVNYAFTQRIWYYCDAIANPTDISRNWSIKIQNPEDNVLGEPSVCVSEDGSTMWLYTHLHRLSTTDGINWSEPENLIYNYATKYIMHSGMCIVDGVFYQIGESQAGDLLLYKSTDGLNFDFVGKLFARGDELVDGKTVAAWGNPYLIRDAGTGRYYLYIELMNNQIGTEYTPWVICLVSCTNLEYDRGTDSNNIKLTGNWSIYADNPIISAPYLSLREIKSNGHDVGNVDFLKKSDNRPYKVNGKYYIYVHSSLKTQTGFTGKIARMSSNNLTSWDFDGTVFDNRVVPESGDNVSTNTDHCIIEFKGRTYLFYTVNINSNYEQYIAYEIDDRPLRQIVLENP